jgi:dTDP-4-dehydrorhamnose reductase
LKILIFGKNGQLGQELISHFHASAPVIALGRDGCDLSNPLQIKDALHKYRPEIIINAGAYTAVDLAQSSGAQDEACAVNAKAPTLMAQIAEDFGAALVHYSTDYVFDGLALRPYKEEDVCNPLSVYGATKLEGEIGVRSHCEKHLILRTSWVYSAGGNNFLKTILKLALSKQELRVINDQIGAPTCAELLARATFEMLIANKVLDPSQCSLNVRPHLNKVPIWGTYHLCAAGKTNWFEYACYVLECAQELGMGTAFTLERSKIYAVTSSEYPQAAPRPLNSRLDTTKVRQEFGLHLPDWRLGVVDTLKKLKALSPH